MSGSKTWILYSLSLCFSINFSLSRSSCASALLRRRYGSAVGTVIHCHLLLTTATTVVHLLPVFGVEGYGTSLFAPSALVKRIALGVRGDVEVQADGRIGVGRVFHPVQADLVCEIKVQ